MLMVIPNEGKLDWTEGLIYWLANQNPTLRVRLFSNNFTPLETSVLADFTEATFTGYASVLIVNANWTNSTLSGNISLLEYLPAPSYTCTGGGGQTVYGWYLHDVTTGHVLAAQKFDVARVITNGSTEKLDPFNFELQTFH